MKELELKTVSELTSFRTCPRLHFFEYVQAVKPLRDAPPLWYGTLVHRGLEQWWLAYQRDHGDDALTLALDELAKAELEDAEKEGFDPYLFARARVMMRAYDARWRESMQVGRYDVIAVEARFTCPLVNPETGASSRTYQLAGKIDVLVYDQAHAVFSVVEHKTSSDDLSPGSAYWQKLRMDPQISTYFHGGDELLHELEFKRHAEHAPEIKITACLYDVIGKPAIKPSKATPEENRKRKKDGSYYANVRLADETVDEFEARMVEHVAENPDRYLGRAEVVRVGDELEEFDFDVWQSVKTLHEGKRLGRFPRNAAACFKWGRPCSFWEVCIGAAEISDESKFRKKTARNEELAATA